MQEDVKYDLKNANDGKKGVKKGISFSRLTH